MKEITVLPDDFPPFLSHSDADTPVPTWKQLTRSTESIDNNFVTHISLIVSGTEDEVAAVEVWNSWPANVRRSTALLVDKILNEGWLESVGPIKGAPWDGGFFFWPRFGDGELARILNEKSGGNGAYTKSSYRAGLPAGLSRRNHKGWKWGWMENDSPLAALHVGVFKDSSAEVHLDVFNPLYVNQNDGSEITRLPLIGRYNHKLFRLHRRWEQSQYGSIVRTSANFYHMMKGRVPLSF
jgi:hypothetical protein